METINSLSIDLFYQLLRIRMIEEAIADRYSEWKMRCPVHWSIGQEAIAVGICHHLKITDYMVSNHRAHAHYLAKGGDLKRMLAEIYGKKTGCSGGRGGSMHLIDREVGIVGTTPIVGGSIPVGVGVAFSSMLKGEDAITTIFFGEGATEEGVWSESINFAALQKLPILFVCENNLYSVYSPMSVRQPDARSRIDIAKAHGIRTWNGDGNDVEEVSRVSEEAIHYVREGEGPAFVEFDTYRYLEHCGPNEDPKGYRPQEEVEEWLSRCPVKHQQEYFSEEEIEKMKEKITEEIEEAFAFAEESEFPEFNLSEESMYAKSH